MTRLARLCLYVLAGLALLRATAFLVYAVARISLPAEVWYLEPKLVLLCWRAEQGVRLYPSWTDYPHVSNFFGPIYAGLVGGIGRIFGLDLPGLTILGRGVTLASGVITSIVLGLFAGRRQGRFAGIAVGSLSLGSAAMIGFGLMVRPDTLANLLGTIGLIVAIEGRGRTTLWAAIPLIVAILTKQTALLMVAGACVGLVSQRRVGLAVGLAMLVMIPIAAIVVGVTSTIEPMFAASLMGESATPWRWASWWAVLGKLVSQSPDLLVIPLIGLWLGRSEQPRPSGWMAAAGVVLLGDLVAVAKHGADLNYFLDLRVIQAWSACLLISTIRATPPRIGEGLGLGLILMAAISLMPGTALSVIEARDAVTLAKFEASPEGLAFQKSLKELQSQVTNRSWRVLTDSAYLQSLMKDRAEFGDPWLFRMQVDEGLIEPSRMEHLLEGGCYDRLILFRDLFAPRDPKDENSLPRGLLYRARARYRLLERRAGLFVYERSRPADGDCPPDCPRSGDRRE